jgi:hypothetical protein
MKEKLYISGPMTGIKDHNFPAFNCLAAKLRAHGYEVVNPTELDNADTTKSWGDYMKRDIPLIVECDGVVLLDGWEESRGAKIEVFLAISLKMKIYKTGKDQFGTLVLDSCCPVARLDIGLSLKDSADGFKSNVLKEADGLVHGNRGEDYGHPLDDFKRTSKIWSAILGNDVTPQQVGLCMIGVKLSREVNRPKRDNRVDIAGYAETLQMVEDRLSKQL